MAMCRWCIWTKSGKVVNILNSLLLKYSTQTAVQCSIHCGLQYNNLRKVLVENYELFRNKADESPKGRSGASLTGTQTKGPDSSISHRCLHNSYNAFQQSTGRFEADALINISHQQNFEADYASSHIPTSTFQKIALFFGSSAVALMDPSRGDMIATLGETGGEGPIKYMQQKMLQNGEGKQILMEKPRINSGTVDLQKLRELPEGSLGRIYTDFLDKNKVGPDSRLMVQFIDDVELAYVIQRYREVHDLVHAILGMPTNMLGEVTVKWIEAIQNKLPMCVGGAVFGAIRLAPKQRKKYVQYYLPWAIKTGLTSEFLLNIYFEKRWEQQVSDLLNEVHITPLKIPKT